MFSPPEASLKYTLMRSSWRSESPQYVPVGSMPCSSQMTCHNTEMEGTSVNKPFWDLRDNEETVVSEGEIATVPPRISRRSGYRIDHLGCGRSRYALELMQTSVCAEGAETRDPDLELQTGRIWWSTRNKRTVTMAPKPGK